MSFPNRLVKISPALLISMAIGCLSACTSHPTNPDSSRGHWHAEQRWIRDQPLRKVSLRELLSDGVVELDLGSFPYSEDVALTLDILNDTDNEQQIIVSLAHVPVLAALTLSPNEWTSFRTLVGGLADERGDSDSLSWGTEITVRTEAFSRPREIRVVAEFRRGLNTS
jgi:hypothetical protein